MAYTLAVPRARLFYGWWVVFAGFGLEVLISALMFHAYGAYAVLLRQEFGWSKTTISAAFSMARAESGILGPIQGWLTDRFGPRALMSAGVIIYGVGFMLFSQITGEITFFVTFFVMALGSSLAGYLAIGTAVVAWFRRRRALALGLAASGMAVGGLLAPLVALSLGHIGWRWTAFASGVVVLAVGLPLAQLVRQRPETYGWTQDGDPAPVAPGGDVLTASVPVAVECSFTTRQALATSAFWYLALGHAAALLVVSTVLVHMVIHITERLGYSIQQAASVVAVLAFMQAVGQLSGGWLGDRFSKRWISAGCMLAHAVALMLLALATAFWMVVVGAGLHGMAWGMRGPLMSAMRADYFGSASFGTITGISSLIVQLGMIGGPLVAGILADRTGSYVPGFTVLAVLAALGSLTFVFARKPMPPSPRAHSATG